MPATYMYMQNKAEPGLPCIERSACQPLLSYISFVCLQISFASAAYVSFNTVVHSRAGLFSDAGKRQRSFWTHNPADCTLPFTHIRLLQSSSFSWCAGILCTREGFWKMWSTGRAVRGPWFVSSCKHRAQSAMTSGNL